MAENLIPPLVIELLRTLAQIVVRIPPPRESDAQSSLRLRTVIFEVYNELIFQMRFHNIDYNDYDLAINRLFEQNIWNIHNLYKTNQVGSIYSAPQ